MVSARDSIRGVSRLGRGVRWASLLSSGLGEDTWQLGKLAAAFNIEAKICQRDHIGLANRGVSACPSHLLLKHHLTCALPILQHLLTSVLPILRERPHLRLAERDG